MTGKVCLESVDFLVRVDQGALAFFSGLGVAMLHAHHALVAFAVDVLEHVEVIDLAGGWFASTGVVADLEIGDLAPSAVDVRDDVAFVNLLMIDIEQDLARGAIHGSADLVTLGDFVEE